MMSSHGSFKHKKYRPFPPISLPDRQWPKRVIHKAPRWCAVDLRDGNQALIDPMSPQQKKTMFDLLVAIGVKEIEVGFPAASQMDFDFVRALIEGCAIPDDVTIQALTPARPALIQRTFDALKGAPRAIVHLYNSTSPIQREQVFKLDKAGVIEIAVQGANTVKKLAEQHPDTDWTFQYSPESFTATELDFSVEICNAVSQIWQPTADKPIVINLPATVEVATPNVYADQVEWFCRNIRKREATIISLHTHNDRGCAVAAAELAVMAGADRVEGTLLGNGERTGNMDLVTMAMNLYSQGIDPELDFSNMDRIIHVVEDCTKLPIHPRHPYAGELVFTAFSGSHQDAIKKCLAQRQPKDDWDVAYLPIDPSDLGRSYQEVIRINSQSGKGGIAYILEKHTGFELPRWLQIEFSAIVQKLADKEGREIAPKTMIALFEQRYLNENVVLNHYNITRHNNEQISVNFNAQNKEWDINGEGNGALDALVNGVNKRLNSDITVTSYHEHSLSDHTASKAVCYLQIRHASQVYTAVSTSEDLVSAPIKAFINAITQAKLLNHLDAA
ncbi:MAG: 2-isopropylmalate synthase [Pseudomonadales bacterium]|nr:2-isopropylmalate synthase [Pseudomonadales bacterium]